MYKYRKIVRGELASTACAPKANALKTSVPRRTPPSTRTGILSPTAATT